jgi:hypothetical protein
MFTSDFGIMNQIRITCWGANNTYSRLSKLEDERLTYLMFCTSDSGRSSRSSGLQMNIGLQWLRKNPEQQADMSFLKAKMLRFVPQTFQAEALCLELHELTQNSGICSLIWLGSFRMNLIYHHYRLYDTQMGYSSLKLPSRPASQN